MNSSLKARGKMLQLDRMGHSQVSTLVRTSFEEKARRMNIYIHIHIHIHIHTHTHIYIYIYIHIHINIHIQININSSIF